MTEWTLAIDFGTSNTAASYRLGDGRIQPVRLSEQAEQMPSAVLVAPDGLRVGTEAVRSQRVHPDGFEESPKLSLGWGTHFLGGREVDPVDLVAAVLGHAARRAMRLAGGAPPTTVVLTHPFDWAVHRQSALREAWRRTGIDADVVVLVSEPVAAASWYAASARPPAGSAVAVVDIGGGTTDVAVVQVGADPMAPVEVLGHDGSGELGGRAVDQLLLAHVRAALVSAGHSDLDEALDDPRNLGALRTLREQVRQAKHALSEWEDASVPVVADGRETVVKLTADELDTLLAPLVARIRDLVRRTLQAAGVSPDDLHALYLTGGSSHLRPVASAMAELLGGRPATLDDPKLVVALGAHTATAAPQRKPASHAAAGLQVGPAEPLPPAPASAPPPQATPLVQGTEGGATSDARPGGGPAGDRSRSRRSPWRWAVPAAVMALVLSAWALQEAAQSGGDGSGAGSSGSGATGTSLPDSAEPTTDSEPAEERGALVADPAGIRSFSDPAAEILGDADLVDYLLPGLTGSGADCLERELAGSEVLDRELEEGAEETATLVLRCVDADSIGRVFGMYAVGFEETGPDQFAALEPCLAEQFGQLQVGDLSAALTRLYTERLDLFGPPTSRIVAADDIDELTTCGSGPEASEPPAPASSPTRRPPRNERPVPWGLLRPGDCLAGLPEGDFTQVVALNCAVSHRFEVVGATFGGSDPAVACTNLYRHYTGRDVEGSGHELTWIAPAPGSLSARLICMAGPAGGGTTRGSLR